VAIKTSGIEREIGVVDVRGNLVGGEETRLFRESVMEKLNQDYRKLVLDFKDVAFMNSTGLGVLISAHTSSARMGGRLVLCNMNNSLSSLLVITGLDRILEVKKTRDQAIESLA
jgi:anti-sigma B factor antagonist